MDDIQPQSRYARSPINTPFHGFISYGLGSTLCVLIGGSCFHRRDLHDEIFTIMYGGMVMGSVMGFLGYYVQITRPEIFGYFDSLFQMIAFFTSPIVGLKVYQPEHTHLYSTILLDWLVGSSILTGSVCVCVLFVYLCFVPCLFGLALFTSSQPSELPVQQLQPLHLQQQNPIVAATFAVPIELVSTNSYQPISNRENSYQQS